jgi:ferritin-like metal-binding protein YciE
MKLDSLQHLLVDQLKDLYSAENQLVKALPKMAKAASTPELRAGFEEHLEQTRKQVERLEAISEQMGISPKGKKCAAMKGLIEEGKELIEEEPDPAVLDAGLIAAAQKVEHYEMASYGCARTWAEQLGLEEAAGLLQETFEEEKETDEKLTELAKQKVNAQAQAGESENGNTERRMAHAGGSARGGRNGHGKK